MKTFNNDDSAYLDWLAAHPDGFVVNTRRPLSADYLVLHRATCHTVRSYPGMAARPGGFTERQYQKLCADSVEALRRALSAHTRRPGIFSGRCPICAPTG